jgi:hypothetical protein
MPTTNHLVFIEQLNQHALTHYEQDGWDYWIECFDNADKLEIIEGAGSYTQALALAKEYVKTLDDHRKEIESTAF